MPGRVISAARRLPIRLKLTLAFAGAMALMLATIGVFLYLHFVSGLDSGIKQALRARANQITTLVQSPSRVGVSQLPLGDTTQSFAQVINASGRVLDASAGVSGALLAPVEIAQARRAPTLIDRHERARLLATPVDHGAMIVVVGVSLAEHEHAIETFGGAMLIGGPLALLLASLAGYGLAGRRAATG